MYALTSSDDERVPVTVVARSLVFRHTYERRLPNINLGVQGEEYFWNHVYPQNPQTIKFWNPNGINIPASGSHPRRWVRHEGDVPFDGSVFGINFDVKTIKRNIGNLPNVGNVFRVLCTPRQSVELVRYFVVYVREKNNKLSVRVFYCMKV